MQHIEVERRFRLVDREPLVMKMADLGATDLGVKHQTDTYFNAPHRDFLGRDSVSEWLRLREEDGSSSINYKFFHPVDALIKTHCDEYESSVGDLGALRLMLLALNFTPIVVVAKVRHEWQLLRPIPVIVALDDVTGAGSFVEFEFAGEAQDVHEAIGGLARFIAGLGLALGEPVDVGYPQILLGRPH